MVTYCPPPPRVSTWIGTWVGVACATAAGRGDGLAAEPLGGACGAQPAASSTRTARVLAERIGAYYGESERNDLEAEREEQTERVDPDVDEERDERRGQPEDET